ncbi:MAG: lipase/acyltransferase domain-containing protein [Minisyncoccota bacterium]
MKKYLIFVLFFFVITVHASASVVEIPNYTTLNSDTTWSSVNGVYILRGSVTVPAGVTLTIDSGTIIKFQNGGSGVLNVYGSLAVHGSPLDAVYFTSLIDDSVGGDTNGDATSTLPLAKDWQGIYFYSSSFGDLDYTVVRYAESGGYGYGDFVAIENDGGIVNINHSTIEKGKHRGIWQKSGEIKIENSTISDHDYGFIVDNGTTTISHSSIQNNQGFGVYYGGRDSVTLTDNNFSGNGGTAVVNAGSNFVHSGNTSNDIASRGFKMYGAFKDGAVLSGGDLPIIVDGGYISVPQGQVLTIAPGTIIKLGSIYGAGAVNVQGNLIAEGTSDSKIYFTSLRDDSVGGDTNGDGGNSLPVKNAWEGFYLENGSTASLKNVVIQYAGQDGGENFPKAAAIYNRGANLSVDKSFIGHNYGAGIFQDAGTTTVSRSELTDERYGLFFRRGEATISQSSMYEISDQAISNESGIATGFPNVVVVDARNNWWGSDTGPRDISTSTPTGIGSRMSANVLYDPWLTRDPALAPLHNPVIIVPGIMGSYLNDQNDSEVWMNLFKMSLPGEDSYLGELELSDVGTSLNVLKPVDIIRKINIPLFTRDTFDGLIKTLENSGYVENIDLFVFPYDWRVDVSETANKLKETIDKIKFQTEATKVDLLVHSMGGLVAKDYIKKFGNDSVENFIDLATPHNGAPKSFETIMYGETDVAILNQNIIKSISQNMPSVYELLPSQKYFDDTDQNYRYYVFDGVNNADRLTFEQTKSYLKTAGRNSLLVDRADVLHQEIDNLNPADYGVKTYNIVGCGTPTIGQIYVLSREGDHYSYNIRMINGDGTVPLKSAKALPALKTYFVKNAQHAVMPSASGVKEIVASILNGDDNPNISSYSNIVMSDAYCPVADGKIVSFHSPIDLNVYDSSGNHAGPDVNGDIENNIPGVVYETIEDNKFAYLPDGQEYNIVGNSTDSGTFDTRIETVMGGEVTSTTLFNDVAISSESQAKFSVGATVPTQISLDKNGDGVFESMISVSRVSAGFIESTGKDRPISVSEEIKISQSVSGSSRRSIQSIVPVIAPQLLNASSAPTQANPINLKTNEPKTVLSIPKINSQNTAVAYKSFGQGLKNAFKSLWGWIKNKI